MSNEVKQYDPMGYDELSGYMQQHPEGDYVRHDDYAALEAECERLRDALAELLGCPFNVEAATVPRAGIEAAPEQVVLNVSVGLMRWRKAKAALAASTGQEVKP